MAEKPLTRNEFYKLAYQCRDYALRLANHDQDSVNRELCLEYNEFLQRVREYRELQQPLAALQTARPITRLTMAGAMLVLWLAFNVVASRIAGQLSLWMTLTAGATLVLLVALVPPAAYGTSVEAIEGRVLVVVQALQQLLEDGEMAFSEAAYFTVRDVLRQASDELRQQVYLSRTSSWQRRW